MVKGVNMKTPEIEPLIDLEYIKRTYSINKDRRCEPLGTDEIDWLINRVETLEQSVQGLIDNLNKSMEQSNIKLSAEKGKVYAQLRR